jgi:hypothetical protein
MTRTRMTIAVLAALAAVGTTQAQPVAPKAAAPATAAAPAAGKALYPQSQFDSMLKEHGAGTRTVRSSATGSARNSTRVSAAGARGEESQLDKNATSVIRWTSPVRPCWFAPM